MPSFVPRWQFSLPDWDLLLGLPLGIGIQEWEIFTKLQGAHLNIWAGLIVEEFLIHGTGTALRPKGPMEMTGVILLGPSHKLLRGNAPHSKKVRPLLKVPLLPSVPQEDTSSTGLHAKLWGQGRGRSHIPVM